MVKNFLLLLLIFNNFCCYATQTMTNFANPWKPPRINFNKINQILKEKLILDGIQTDIAAPTVAPPHTHPTPRSTVLQFFRRINVCHTRFQRCSKQLSPFFCANYTNQYNFYIWARKLATRIMKGNDGEIYCPAELLQIFLQNGNILELLPKKALNSGR